MLVNPLYPILARVDFELDTETKNTPFRIKNALTGEYLSSKDDSDGSHNYTLSPLDEENESQYFRFILTPTGESLLNSADSEAKYCLSFSPSYKKSNLKRSETKEAYPIKFLKLDESSFAIQSTYDEQIYSLTNSEDGICFSSSANESSLWEIEYVTPSVFTMAYFETRVKLYSVKELTLNIKPEALSSFVEWRSSDESIIIPSSKGTICALSEGEATVMAILGESIYECRVEVYNKDAFAWFSQTNYKTSYWNGEALNKIKFKSRLFVSSSGRNWMDSGCAISSVAMVFCNLGATYTNGYDFRSDREGNLPADPYTVALANAGYYGFKSNSGSYYADPVYTRWSAVTNAFNVNGSSLSYRHIYSGNRKTIKNYLAKHPEGIVVQMTKPNGATHYIVIAECLNPEEKTASKLRFLVYDPLSYDGSDGDGVTFEESASYKLGYRYSHFTSFFVWDVK